VGGQNDSAVLEMSLTEFSDDPAILLLDISQKELKTVV
jgi:hypothetical protein